MNSKYKKLVACLPTEDAAVLSAVKKLLQEVIKTERAIMKKKARTNLDGLKRKHEREIEFILTHPGINLKEHRRQTGRPKWQETKYDRFIAVGGASAKG